MPLYFFTWVMIGSLFLVNLLVGVLIDNFNRLREVGTLVYTYAEFLVYNKNYVRFVGVTRLMLAIMLVLVLVACSPRCASFTKCRRAGRFVENIRNPWSTDI